ncbi:Succinate--CoA ligase [GDP-forming] subunit beta, mitochondrial [Haplosporangium sp. Z 27]|nr:Succinate--CoA ligase [GDP-forming] subunit beta, mitochondrial [Haplosporangium sp. Z 27]
MATSRRALSKGTSILKQTHLEQRCTIPNFTQRYNHTTAAGNMVQEDSTTRSDSSRISYSQGCIGSSTKRTFSLLSTPARYIQHPPISFQSILSRRSLITNHNFNTNKVVSKLEKDGFERGQAESIMRTIKALIGHHTTRVRKNMITKDNLENESYLFKAALTELRTELQILRKNDAAALAIKSEIISREIDSLNQKLGEDIANVKNDIAIDMNSRKSDVREEQKQLEIRIQSMSNHYMAQIGDMRTRMEAAKWETARKGMAKAIITSQVRYISLHEYQSKQLISKHNVNVQRFVIADSVEQAENAAAGLKAKDIVIKAQIHAGGRGKGEFSSGLKSGVHFTKDPAKVPHIVSEMLGYKLKTKQTTGDGAIVSKVMIAEALEILKETYFAVLLDRQTGGPVFIGCPEGGMDIEQLAQAHPDHIYKVPIDIDTGPTENQALDLAMKLGFQGKAVAEAAEQMHRLYEVFLKVDATQIEINPFGLTPDNKTVVCFDAKIKFDDNAAFRHPELQAMRDRTEENPREIEAEQYGLNYVGLDGSIGCLVNGAGLALATMDIIKLHGAMPANFLDVGGGVTATQVSQAFRILTEDKNVKAILVNIFGGIASCQTIAEGILNALTEGPKVKIPIVVRMQGSQVEEGKALLEKSRFKFTLKDDLDEAAIACVERAAS